MSIKKNLNIAFSPARRSLIFSYVEKITDMALNDFLVCRRYLAQRVEVICFDKSMRDFYPYSVEGWFRGFRKLKCVFGIDNFHTKRIKNYRSMFEGCCSLEKLNLLKFVPAQNIDVTDMFAGCNKLRQLKIPQRYKRQEACIPLQAQTIEYYITEDIGNTLNGDLSYAK